MNRPSRPPAFDNSYEGIRLDGLQRAKTIDGKARAEAQCALSACTVRGWGAEWLHRRQASGVRAIKDDRNRWRVHVEEFAPWVDLPLTAVTRAMAREWWSILVQRRSSSVKDKSRARVLEAQTLRNILNLVRLCFQDALEEGLVSLNPFVGLKVHRSRRATTRAKSTVAELHEQAAGLAAMTYPDRWIVEVALGSGMRQGEQWGLLVADVHVDCPRPFVTARFGHGDGPTKAGSIHTIWLFGMALEAMRKWLAQLSRFAPENPFGLVFPRRDGSRRAKSEVFRSFGRFARAIGRHFRWHDLRHSCGTSLLAGWWDPPGVPPVWSLEAVCSQFGHSSTKVTERYARIVKELAQKAASRMALPRVSLHVPESARPRARRRSASGSKGNPMNDSNDVDADTTAGENAEERRGSQVVRHRFAKPECPAVGGASPGLGVQTPAEICAKLRRAVSVHGYGESGRVMLDAATALDVESKRANELATGHFEALKENELLTVAHRQALKERDVALGAYETERGIANDRLRHIHDLRAELAKEHAQPAVGLFVGDASYLPIDRDVRGSDDACDRDLSLAYDFVRELREVDARNVSGDMLAVAATQLHRFATCWWEAENRTRAVMSRLAEARATIADHEEAQNSGAHRAPQPTGDRWPWSSARKFAAHNVAVSAERLVGGERQNTGDLQRLVDDIAEWRKAIEDEKSSADVRESVGGARFGVGCGEEERTPSSLGAAKASGGDVDGPNVAPVAVAGRARTLGSAPLKFAVGDRVRVSAPKRLDHGRCGRIVDYDGDDVRQMWSVELDPRVAAPNLLGARLWCSSDELDIAPTTPEHSHVQLLRDCLEALNWCAGSTDFQEGGTARLGWTRNIVPLIVRLREALGPVAHRASSPMGTGIFAPLTECEKRAAQLREVVEAYYKACGDGPGGVREFGFNLANGTDARVQFGPRTPPPPEEAFRATELAATNRVQDLEALLGDERRERRQALGEALALRTRLRVAVGLLTDVAASSARIAAFLTEESGR